MDFTEQLCVFESTDVLVATAGTAIHNILFMHSNAIVVILMQEGEGIGNANSNPEDILYLALTVE